MLGWLGLAKLIFRTIISHNIMISLNEKEVMPWSSEFSSAAFSWDFPWASRPWLSCPPGTTGSKAKRRKRRQVILSAQLLPSVGLTVRFRPGRRPPESHVCLLPGLEKAEAHTWAAGPRGRSRHHFIQGAMICRAPVTFHALTAIWRLPSLFLEEDKMGMIAFYAGLFIGVLWGLLFSSLLAFSLAKRPRGSQPNQAEGYSQVDPQ